MQPLLRLTPIGKVLEGKSSRHGLQCLQVYTSGDRPVKARMAPVERRAGLMYVALGANTTAAQR